MCDLCVCSMSLTCRVVIVGHQYDEVTSGRAALTKTRQMTNVQNYTHEHMRSCTCVVYAVV